LIARSEAVPNMKAVARRALDLKHTIASSMNRTMTASQFGIFSRIRADSGEGERNFRREAERHSGLKPNTIGA
jgi:hypothetical protein